MRQFFRNLLVGSKTILTSGVFKYALLRGQYALIMIICILFYIIYNWMLGIYAYMPYYFGGIVIAIIVIYLNRNKHFKSASIILLVTVNLLVYLFSDIQEPFGSVFFYYGICSLTGVIFLRPHSKWLSYFFGLVPFFVGLFAYYYDMNLVGANVPSTYNFQINFSISIFLCLLFVQFMVDRSEEEIQEKNLIENELKIQNELLTKTNKELDHFVYSVSHDLRAPLSSILGLTNIYSMTDNMEERKSINKMIQARVNDLDSFIKEVLDYSRNERLRLKISPTYPKATVDKIVDSLNYMTGFDQVIIENKIDPSLEIKTDPERLQVIFTNLIANSINYRDSSKDMSTITLDAQRAEDYWQFKVRDNGIGIEEIHRDKIFEMFYRANEDNPSGSGLGLYIVKETVSRLKGSIKVESQFGDGTTFIIEIPIPD